MDSFFGGQQGSFSLSIRSIAAVTRHGKDEDENTTDMGREAREKAVSEKRDEKMAMTGGGASVC